MKTIRTAEMLYSDGKDIVINNGELVYLVNMMGSSYLLIEVENDNRIGDKNRCEELNELWARNPFSYDTDGKLDSILNQYYSKLVFSVRYADDLEDINNADNVIAFDVNQEQFYEFADFEETLYYETVHNNRLSYIPLEEGCEEIVIDDDNPLLHSESLGREENVFKIVEGSTFDYVKILESNWSDELDYAEYFTREQLSRLLLK